MHGPRPWRAREAVTWGRHLRQPRQTTCALGQRARRHYWLAPRSDDAVGAAVLGQGAAEPAAETVRSTPLRFRKIGCGSAGASSPKPDAYLQAFSAAGFQEMRPALVPARAGWGDAVTGISRADSASANATTLRPRFVVCNGSVEVVAGLGAFDSSTMELDVPALLTKGATSRRRAAYPPPRVRA